MDLKYFISGLKNILSDPSKAWGIINAEHKPLNVIRQSIVLPLVLLVSVAAMAGSLMFSNNSLPPAYSVFTGLRTFLVLIITIYVASYVLGEITYPLDLGKDFYTSFTIVSFSFVPFMLCQIFSGLFESLLFVNIIGLYGLYIFWAGAEKFLDPPQYKKMPLLIATSVIAVGIYIITNEILKTVLDKLFYAIFD
ncbi:MAG TPA: YIP1 family protein [Bacteroidales bacterium]|nr:YIP1 family protein [Bacteroidales bacterium]